MLRNLLFRRPDWTVFVVTTVLCLSMMFLERRAQERVVWFLQHTVLAPAEMAAGWVERGVGTYWENERLRQRAATLQMEVDAMRAERGENARLRRLLELDQRHPYVLLAADVAGRTLDRLGGSLTLDKGEKDGVFANRAILTPEGLVGRVERATAHQSRVLTILHRDCAVAARVARTRVEGVVRWGFGDRPTLHLLYVSSQEDVKPGDLIVTSGQGGIFPGGIRIGTVEKVALEENGLMKEIVVETAVDFRGLEQVLVYTPSEAGAVAPSDLLGVDAPADSSVAPDSAAAAAAAVKAGSVTP
ncbi:MAG TPA: rod shape-determining protein MreC [Candidatus Eisenbacteria bacterium]|nr:rod shape-determining protein MreC [Candidatus Eisenbacteria bacterium]